MKYMKNKEPRNRQKSVRFPESTYQGLMKSDADVCEMVDLYLLFENDENFALLKEKERKLAIIRDLESERVEHELKINNIDDMVANLKLDIKEINKQMHEKGFDLKTYKNKKDLDNCIQKTIDYYNDHYTHNNREILTMEDFLQSDSTKDVRYLNNMATRSGMHDDVDGFKALVLQRFNGDVQQTFA